MEMNRRKFLATSGATATALATLAVAPGARAQMQEGPMGGRGGIGPLSQRYPDPLIQVIDPSFNRYRLGLAKVERIASGMRWTEGPVYFGDARHLLWSDIPNNRIMKWEEETGRVSVFRKPSNNANGNTRDRQGRLLTCEHDTRRITRTEYDGSITLIADRYHGNPLNSPNDLVCTPAASPWFPAPPFGVLGNYEGHVAKPELPTNVYR